MKTWSICFAVALLLPGLGCAVQDKRQSRATSDSTPPVRPVGNADSEKDANGFIVIGYLVKRDEIITLKSGPRGPVYSVETKDGKVRFENLSAEQLRAQAPEIHDFIKTGMAGDARVRPLR